MKIGALDLHFKKEKKQKFFGLKKKKNSLLYHNTWQKKDDNWKWVPVESTKKSKNKWGKESNKKRCRLEWPGWAYFERSCPYKYVACDAVKLTPSTINNTCYIFSHILFLSPPLAFLASRLSFSFLPISFGWTQYVWDTCCSWMLRWLSGQKGSSPRAFTQAKYLFPNFIYFLLDFLITCSTH